MLGSKLQRVAAAAILCLTLLPIPVSAEAAGQFIGDLNLLQLSDGETFEVRSRFVYVDASGQRWPVPQGSRTDCASVPRAAWSIFPPCRGKHLKAAVVHDYYCDTRRKPWNAVHRMFYDALRAAGVGDLAAKTMYAAVYYFGPRWDEAGTSVDPPRKRSTIFQKHTIEHFRHWIKTENPPLNEIEQKLAR